MKYIEAKVQHKIKYSEYVALFGYHSENDGINHTYICNLINCLKFQIKKYINDNNEYGRVSRTSPQSNSIHDSTTP